MPGNMACFNCGSSFNYKQDNKDRKKWQMIWILRGELKVERVIFWNNKGGIGKTTLAFQLLNEYAYQNQDKRMLVIDVCPQANLSELLLGGD